jgi:hypothetical protein
MKKYIMFIGGFLFLGCDKLCDIPPLKTKRLAYNGNALRFDGLYHTKDANSLFFLYKNGVGYYWGCVEHTITAIPDRFRCSLDAEMIAAGKKIPYAWGIYLIQQDSIRIETWGQVADCAYETFFQMGKILNDSTLLIQRLRNAAISDTFYFAAFSPKPDSTNKFIP